MLLLGGSDIIRCFLPGVDPDTFRISSEGFPYTGNTGLSGQAPSNFPFSSA